MDEFMTALRKQLTQVGGGTGTSTFDNVEPIEGESNVLGVDYNGDLYFITVMSA